MMYHKLENIRLLVIKEVQGTLSEDERTELLREIEIDSLAKEATEDLLRASRNSKVIDYLNSTPSIDPAKRLIGNINSYKRRTRAIYIITLASAAAICTLLLRLPYLLNERNSSNVEGAIIKHDIHNKNSTVVSLTLPSGKIMDLSKKNVNVIEDGNAIKASNKQLSYEATSNSINQFGVLSVPVGKDYNIKLSDGSSVQLNSMTSLRFPLHFNDDFREIYVDGEAYFSVSTDPKKPFVVHMPKGTVRVLGTEFNVNTYDSTSFKISLIRGRVKITADDTEEELAPGEQAVLVNERLFLQNFDEYETLSWREGKFIFHDTPLSEVCNAIPRWYATNIIVDDKNVLKKKFTGKIHRNQPLEILMQGLKAAGIEYYIDKNGMYHIK